MRAIYPGTFDPFTLGHLDIALRAARLFDELIIGIAFNLDKSSALDSRIRKEVAELSLKGKASNIKVEEFSGLTTDFALKSNCGAIVRGLRNISDYEKEKDLSRIYKELSGIETVFLFSLPQYEHISSSLTKELIYFNKGIDNFVAKPAKELIINLYKKS